MFVPFRTLHYYTPTYVEHVLHIGGLQYNIDHQHNDLALL